MAGTRKTMGKTDASVKYEDRMSYIKSIITGEMARYDISHEELSSKAHMNERTLTKRVQEDQGSFRLDELYKIMDILGVKIIFVRKQQPG